jgi:predicted DNA-binding WGR domain protein
MGRSLRIRYGRIGTDGTLQTSSFPTVEKARAEAQKKIKSKTSKGYAPAVMGERKRRSVTRRVIQSAPSTARSSAPLLWKFSTGRSAFGVFIDDRHCWVGNENGEVYCLNHRRGGGAAVQAARWRQVHRLGRRVALRGLR